MQKAISALQRGISNLLARAVVSGLDTASKCQMLQISMVANEGKDQIEHLEPYGFTSAPLAGAEALAAFFDGDRSHGVVLMVADRRYRIKGLTSGEVAIYTDEGDNITLKRGRIIEVNTDQFIVNAAEKVTFNTPLVEAPSGEIKDKISTLSTVRQQFNDHDHSSGSSGTTGKPNQQMGGAS